MKYILYIFFVINVTYGNEKFDEIIVTNNYEITIINGCEEGCVSCEKITMLLKSKATNKVKTIIGTTVHRIGADGVTPAGFLGYKFKDNNITYQLWQRGIFQIIETNRKLQVNESWTQKGNK